MTVVCPPTSPQRAGPPVAYPRSYASCRRRRFDEHGCLWPDVKSVRRHAHPDAVEAEWRAQIERTQAAGIDVTHLDTHMGSVLAPERCVRYVALGVEPYTLTTMREQRDRWQARRS